MDKYFDKIEDPRRRMLIEALAVGAVAAGAPAGNALAAGFFGSSPGRLPKGRSIYRLQGSAFVNGKAANLRTPVRPGDTIETGANSEIIFVVGTQSMILRSNGRLVVQGESKAKSFFLSALRLFAGKLLSVSRNSRMRLTTATATIGIRGTGWYAEADPEQTYFCTCYGTTDVAANDDPRSAEIVESKQHDRPLYILANAPEGQSIRDAPFINHTDQELALIEALVGREPPFVFSKDDYMGPRLDY